MSRPEQYEPSADPVVGQRYIATDNAAACQALGMGVVIGPAVFVSVSSVHPEVRKVQVSEDEFWLTYDELAAYFRLRNVGPLVQTDDEVPA